MTGEVLRVAAHLAGGALLAYMVWDVLAELVSRWRRAGRWIDRVTKEEHDRRPPAERGEPERAPDPDPECAEGLGPAPAGGPR